MSLCAAASHLFHGLCLSVKTGTASVLSFDRLCSFHPSPNYTLSFSRLLARLCLPSLSPLCRLQKLRMTHGSSQKTPAKKEGLHSHHSVGQSVKHCVQAHLNPMRHKILELKFSHTLQANEERDTTLPSLHVSAGKRRQHST